MEELDDPYIRLTDNEGFELDRIYYDPDSTPDNHKKAISEALQTALDILLSQQD